MIWGYQHLRKPPYRMIPSAVGHSHQKSTWQSADAVGVDHPTCLELARVVWVCSYDFHRLLCDSEKMPGGPSPPLLLLSSSTAPDQIGCPKFRWSEVPMLQNSDTAALGEHTPIWQIIIIRRSLNEISYFQMKISLSRCNMKSFGL